MSDDTTHHRAARACGYRADLEPAGRTAAVARPSAAGSTPKAATTVSTVSWMTAFIERYAAKCADDGTVIIAYIENGVVRGAAELHPPEPSDDGVPEIAFSVETSVRRQGVGSILFSD